MNHRIWMGLLAALLAATVGTVRPAAASTAFPHFPCIEANVAFWKDVFSRYTSRQGILHDDTELGIVYGTVDLLPRDLPGAVEENRSRIRKAKAQWHRRLLRLSVNPAPQDDRDRRILALFGPGASPRELRAAARRIRCQTGQSDRFRSGLVRSGRHMESFRRIFREEGLPEELTYLPHVESSFDVHAFSKAGAAGIWQFTRSTGRRFLRIDEVVDERRDPLRSARAAAMLLKENYEKLGSWPLASRPTITAPKGWSAPSAATGTSPPSSGVTEADPSASPPETSMRSSWPPFRWRATPRSIFPVYGRHLPGRRASASSMDSPTSGTWRIISGSAPTTFWPSTLPSSPRSRPGKNGSQGIFPSGCPKPRGRCGPVGRRHPF